MPTVTYDTVVDGVHPYFYGRGVISLGQMWVKHFRLNQQRTLKTQYLGQVRVTVLMFFLNLFLSYAFVV